MPMTSLREWIDRLLGTFRPRRRDHDLEEELRAHLEMAAADAQRRGESSDAAARSARVRAGGVTQAMESLRDQRGWPRLAGFTQDLRLARRSLAAAPIITAIAVGSVALAIGANTAVFSILNGLILRSLPVSAPDRLVHVTDSIPIETGALRIRAWSNPFWEQLHQRSHLFESTTAWSFVRFDLASGGEAQFVDGVWADSGFFDTLGVTAQLGRTFSAADDRGTDGPVAVISHGFWQRQFGGTRDVIGRQVRLNGVPFAIIGVTPAGFFGTEVGRTFDVIVPLRTEPLVRGRDSVLAEPASSFLTIIARLRRGQSADAATEALRLEQPAIRQATVGAWEPEVVDRYLASPFALVPAANGSSTLRRTYQEPLVVMAIVVGLVLLVGCVNIANLLLARAAARRHELGMQVVLGASRWRLVRQLFAESFVISGLGALMGLAVAGFLSRFLVRQLSTTTNAVFLDTSIDSGVLAFTAAVACLTTLLFGTAPALRTRRIRPVEVLNSRSRTTTDRTHRGVMSWLVVVQVALSVVLIVAAGLFLQSFATLASRDLGLNPDPVVVVLMDGQRVTPTPLDRVAIYERVRDAVLNEPTVAAAALSHLTPVGGGEFTPPVQVVTTAGRVEVPANGAVFGNVISPGWFPTFGTPVRVGRDFAPADRRGAPRVAIVNETFARRFLSHDAIGRTLTVYPNSDRAMAMEVVGVVADAVYGSPRDPVPPTWYSPIAQFDLSGLSFRAVRLSVRAEGSSPAMLTKTIASRIATVNPQISLTFRPLADQIEASLTRERLMAQLAGFFGGLALLLAALGLYGVTAYAVSRRRTEVGIRLALGAPPSRVVRLMLARVWLLIAIGVVTGAGISYWSSAFAADLLHGVTPRDSSTMAGAVLVLVVMGLLAGWLPARRAARIDPAQTLRDG